MKKGLLFTSCFFILCLHNVCFANPVVVFQLPSFGGFLTMTFWQGLLVDCVADFIVLLIGYLIIKEIRCFSKLAFLPYFGLVLVGGIIFDTIAIIPTVIFGLSSSSDWLAIVAFFICPVLLLYFFHYFLSKRFFKLRPVQAKVIGILMGVLTNPAVGWLLMSIFKNWTRYWLPTRGHTAAPAINV